MGKARHQFKAQVASFILQCVSKLACSCKMHLQKHQAFVGRDQPAPGPLGNHKDVALNKGSVQRLAEASKKSAWLSFISQGVAVQAQGLQLSAGDDPGQICGRLASEPTAWVAAQNVELFVGERENA